MYRYPIESILSSFGRRIDRPGNHGNYYSPFREERTPSFSVDPVRNVWFDHGLGIGGGVVALVGMIRGCSKAEALDYLASLSPDLVPIREISSQSEPVTLIIDSHGPLCNPVLFGYADSFRMIRASLLSMYCEEVHYHFSSRTSGSFFSIGFPTNAGGWVLRNSRMKLCSCPSGITTIDRHGEFSLSPSTDSVAVFEGFFDFLSWLEWKGISRPECDVLVLNSTSHRHLALDYLRSHDSADLYLDNDHAGRDTFRYISQYCPSVMVHDSSGLYLPYNDFNEFLMQSRCATRD